MHFYFNLHEKCFRISYLVFRIHNSALKYICWIAGDWFNMGILKITLLNQYATHYASTTNTLYRCLPLSNTSTSVLPQGWLHSSQEPFAILGTPISPRQPPVSNGPMTLQKLWYPSWTGLWAFFNLPLPPLTLHNLCLYVFLTWSVCYHL